MPRSHREQLEKIGIFLGERVDPKDIVWENHFEQVKAHLDKNGDIDSLSQDLKRWIINQRQNYKYGFLSDERYRKLCNIGIEFHKSKPSTFSYGIDHIMCFYKAHPSDERIEDNYVCDDGFELGKFICRMEKEFSEGKLPPSKIKYLNAAGIRF